jgi:hypothetical protein
MANTLTTTPPTRLGYVTLSTLSCERHHVVLCCTALWVSATTEKRSANTPHSLFTWSSAQILLLSTNATSFSIWFVPLVNGFSCYHTLSFYHNSYETTVESMSLNGFVRTATHTSPFPRQEGTPFWWTTAAHQPVVKTGTTLQVAPNLKCWRTLCKNRVVISLSVLWYLYPCCDISIRLVTINFQIRMPYSLILCIYFQRIKVSLSSTLSVVC